MPASTMTMTAKSRADRVLQSTEKPEHQLPSLRRSLRAATRRTSNSPAFDIMDEPKRNPKRKATESASQVTKPSGKLLGEALAPLTPQDIQAWEGWIELESEPAFFNIILRDLGVKDVKAQEIFTMDQDSLDLLPKPVFGLIFLFQYLPTAVGVEEDEDTSEVWFANQTTDNACATVAMLNIIMNAGGIDLGQNLCEFKESTKHLSTPLRGHQLSRNTFIRSIHNSFTRRMDHLNADLFLENEATEAMSKQTKKRAMSRKGKKAPKKRRGKAEYGYHFTAYVPAGGYVWELDGLKSKPRRLSAMPSDHWTSVARPQIEGRMLQYEESQLSFNLLALCQSPLAAHSKAIAQAAASLNHVDSQMKENPDFCTLVALEPKALDTDDEAQLSEFDLTSADIEKAAVPPHILEKTSGSKLGTHKGYQLHQELVIEVKASMGEYRAEMMAIADDEQRVKGRKKDYGPALHKWVSKLAEKGVLEDIIKTAK